jgi:adenosylcobyric acid synthase
VNMHVAEVAEAPVIMVGDIDKGGLFAQLVGTIELLAPNERARVAGFLINKFRGEVALLKDGLDFLQARFGIPVLGVVPWISRLRIADEDSVALQSRTRRSPSSSELYVAVVRLPFVSNYDDFLALEHEHGVHLQFVTDVRDLDGADLVILPGTKSTVSDLAWLSREGLSREIIEHAECGGLVLGICGGCQMLGQTIEDPDSIESNEPVARGLGLLPLRTHFEKAKTTARVVSRPNAHWFAADGLAPEIIAYEIHMGTVSRAASIPAAFTILSRNGDPVKEDDGAVSRAGNVVGTMLHGLFENASLRTAVLAELRRRKGLPAVSGADAIADREAEYDRLAAAVRASIDVRALRKIIGI